MKTPPEAPAAPPALAACVGQPVAAIDTPASLNAPAINSG